MHHSDTVKLGVAWEQVPEENTSSDSVVECFRSDNNLRQAKMREQTSHVELEPLSTFN